MWARGASVASKYVKSERDSTTDLNLECEIEWEEGVNERSAWDPLDVKAKKIYIIFFCIWTKSNYINPNLCHFEN